MYYIGMDTATAYNGNGLNRAETVLWSVCGAGKLACDGAMQNLCKMPEFGTIFALSHIFIRCNSLQIKELQHIDEQCISYRNSRIRGGVFLPPKESVPSNTKIYRKGLT